MKWKNEKTKKINWQFDNTWNDTAVFLVKREGGGGVYLCV